MDRARKILALCLAAVFLVTLTVYAAAKKKDYSFKVKQNGVNVFIQYTENALSRRTKMAWLKNSKNKIVLSWKNRNPKKIYRLKGGMYCNYFPYNINMQRFKPGKYVFYVGQYGNVKGVRFTYAGSTYVKYNSSKVIRNNNGDLVQRFYFKRNNAKGKMIHAQIYNSKNQLIRSFKFKSGASNQLFTFNWNGWPGKNSVKRCPRGVYTLKYWVEGSSPRTAKFKLAI